MKKLEELPKKSLALSMIVVILLNYILPITTVFAQPPADTSTFGIISINGNNALENKTNTDEITATYEHGIISISGTSLYSDGNNNVYAAGNVTANCTANANYTCELWKDGNNSHGTTVTINNLSSNDIINIDATFESTQDPNPTPQQGNTQATINISAGAGTYNINKQNPNTGEYSLQTVDYDDMANFYINGTMWDPSYPTINYNSETNATTVDFKFETLWINRYYENIVINGQSYTVSDYLDFDDRTEWLVANHGEQTVSFTIPNVAKSDTYNIVVKHGENNGTKYFATFLWTADPSQEYKIQRDQEGNPILNNDGSYKYILDANGNKISGENYIGHSKLEFVKAEYEVGGVNYTVTEDGIENLLVREGDFDTYHSNDGFLNYGVTADVNYDDGSLTLPGNAKVTMRVVPEYGYQVTGVNGGANFTTTDNGVSEFTVTVAEGTAGYFNATVEKVDDEVLANSNKVSSGTIEIANGDINSGTVRLSVDDVELSSNKINNFKEAAGNKYEINSYLDINLNKVLYRGTSESVWSEQIHHLNNKALVTLKLEDGVDVSNVVIVHNIDDGEEFEIIEIESYDSKTNTITFYTDSFSNYAIATKTSNLNKTNPKTGDYIMFYGMLLILSSMILSGVIVYIRKKQS